MGTFKFSSKVLTPLREGSKLNQTITYKDEFGVSHPVTITTSLPNTTITIESNTISGYFSSVFDNQTIKYVTEDGSIKVAKSLKNVPSEYRGSVFSYEGDTTVSKDYTYTATANGESTSFTITINNDHFSNRNRLMNYVNTTDYEKLIVDWLNTSKDVNWFANTKEVDWITDVWPWYSEVEA